MKKSYDVVIVGAGTAGCAMARRLRQDHPELSVALLEQGGHVASPQWPRCVSVPFLQPFITASPAARRSFTRTYVGECETGLANRALTYTRGQGLGGSSLINDMTCRRGTRRDFASWGSASDAWSFDALLPHYCALEANERLAHGGTGGDSRSCHGNEGPVPCTDVQRSNRDSSLNVRFFEACEAAGVAPTDDINAGEADGYTSLQSLVRDGRRVDVYGALLGETVAATSSSGSGRLDVLPHATVTRVRFSATRATGVDVRVASGGVEAINTGLVVCCAGALGSPALLMQSGVGAGGAVIDLPAVGQNLIQGTVVDLIFRIQNCADVYSKSVSLRRARYFSEQWREYREEKTGIFTSLAEAAAYVRSVPSLAAPDLSLQLFRTPQVGWQGWRRAGLMDGFTIRVAHHYPRSRGAVTYDAASGKVHIRSELLTVMEDVRSLDEGIQWAGLLTSDNLKSVYYQDKRGNAVGPFWSYQPIVAHPRRGLHTQKDTAAFLAQFAEGSPDLFGTCAMGAVVDTELRVKGLDGLVVADASVVPAPTMASSAVLGGAIADRAAARLV